MIITADQEFDLYEWWRRQKGPYPTLSRFAFDMLAIPAMSAECERVFSSTKLLLTEKRSRMKEDIIEECFEYTR